MSGAHPITLRKWSLIVSKLLMWGVLALFISSNSPLSAQVTANFSASPLSGCAPQIVNFSDLSTGGVTFWQWNFGNGNTSTLQNPSTTYLNPGSYTVTLITGNGSNRDTLVIPNYITVFPNPIADFNFGPSSGCQPLDVIFTDNALPGGQPIISWLWDFGDGNTSNLQNPTHTYLSPGTFPVSLQVTDAAGCTNALSVPGAVTVFPLPTANFSASPLGGCTAPLNVQFTNLTTGAAFVSWEFGDGGTSSANNPSHTYLNTGTYTVTLYVVSADGCRDTLEMPNYISIGTGTAAISASDTTICFGDSILFSNLSSPPGSSWEWFVSNGATSSLQNPSIGFPDPGTYDVTFVVHSAGGCTDTVVKPGWIYVDSLPDTNFTATPSAQCVAPLVTTFSTANIPGATYTWDFGDATTGSGPNPTHTYVNNGFYGVQMIVNTAAGCVDTATVPYMILVGPPEAGFYADTMRGCVPLDVNFFGNVTFTTSNIVSYFWDLGNGVTSTLQNPTTTYTVPGAYNVTLIVVNAEGCSDTITEIGYIQAGVKPTANFSAFPNPACGNQEVMFFDSTNNATSWYWDFGDGYNSGSQFPSHIYSDTGTFTVTLEASNFGCKDTFELEVQIYPPIAQFTWSPDPVCSIGDTTSFLNSSIGADSVFWDLANGVTSTQFNPIRVFSTPGLYNIVLYAYNFATGCADTVAQLVQVTTPSIDFSASTPFGCADLTTSFTDLSVGPANDWLWDFGDGTTSLAQNPTHTYTVPGIYSVELEIGTIWGCRLDTVMSQMITVGGVIPIVNPLPNPVCLTDTMQFFNSSTSPVGIAQYSWAFGDGGTSTAQSPVHAYNNAGTYGVQLVQTDSLGCVDSAVVQVIVGTGYFNVFVDSVYCIGDTVSFFNFSASNANYFWDFGDGDTSSVYAPTHYYDTLGNYQVVFTGFDAIGCRDTIEQNVWIVDPLAAFTANPTVGSCPPMLVQFTNQSSWDIVGWQWDFGDGSSSILPNPSHNYITPGNFTVQLIVTSAGGCTDTITLPNFIQLSGPLAGFTLTPDSGCSPLSVDFTATGSNVFNWQWDFGDGNTANGSPTISHVYSSGGTFYPALIVEDSLGCTVAYPGDSVTAYPVPVVNFSVPAQIYCGLGTSIPFTNLTTSGGAVNTWLWDFGDGSTSTLQNPTHTYANYGTYTVSLIAESVNGCRDTLEIPAFIQIYQPPIAAFSDSTIAGPGPKPWYFTDSSTFYSAPASWIWDISGSIVSGSSVSFTWSTCGIYPVTLIVTDIHGCADTASQLINPYQPPVVDAGAGASFCAGTSGVQLQSVITTAGAAPYYYTWWCDSTNTFCGIDSVFDDDPFVLPTTSTWYFVQVTDNMGCQSNIDSVWVEVLPIPVANAGPDRFICPDSAPGSLLSSSISGAAGPYQYQWSPAAGLNNTTVPNPYARPDTTTIYTLIVTGANGCSSATSTLDTVSTVTVNVYPQPIAEAGLDRDICLGEGLQLQGFGYNAGPAYDFEWSPYTGLSDSSIANPLASPAATTDYILTVWSNGCPGTDTVTVRVHSLPTADAGPATDICLGSSTILSASGSGDPFSSTYTYSWSPAASLNDPNASHPVATPDTTTTYYVSAISEFGCEGPPDSVKIVVIATPVAEAGPQQIVCTGDSVQLLGGYYYSTTDSANPSMIYFAWSPSTGLLSDSTLTNPWVNPTQTGFYYLDVRHNICHTRDSVLVTVNPDLGTTASVDTSIICQGDSVQLYASGGLGGGVFSWIPASGVSNPAIANPMAAPDSTTDYLLVLSEGGCKDTISVPVNVIPTPTIAYFSTVASGCAPLTVVFLDDSEDLIFRTWYFGDGTISNAHSPTHTYSQPGDYTVSMTGVNVGGCDAERSDLIIHVADPAVADFSSDPAFPAELPLPAPFVQFTDQSSGAVSWNWKFGDGNQSAEQNPVHIFEREGEFYATLSIVTAEGCLSTITKGPYRIFGPELFIPNVFSPNDDQINDGFRADYSGSQPFTLSIFDRWGGLIFSTKDKLEYWNGTNLEGKKVPEGVYYYRIQVGDQGYAGDVTLLR